VTKRVKDGTSFKGGVTSFDRFESDLKRLLYGAGDAFVTTLLVIMACRKFSGYVGSPHARQPELRVRHVEAAIHAHFHNHPRLLPFPGPCMNSKHGCSAIRLSCPV